MKAYESFIKAKRLTAPPCGIANPPELSPLMFPFQRDITRWALRRGKAAIWADCGLGKSWMSLEWARVVSVHTGKPVLILTPLAVARQFVNEGKKIGVTVTHCRDGSDIEPGINVTNYERLHLFEDWDFGGVVLDESSILKDYTSSTRNALISRFERTAFKLACTATPAPNDHIELGNHAEFLGVMSRTEMLSMFFVHDGGSTQDWRLKGHAEQDFWRWVCSWAVSIRKPSDLGYADDGYQLPPLNTIEHVVQHDDGMAKAAGMLFAFEASTLDEQRAARRGSLGARVARAAEIVAQIPDVQWLVWCDLNDESGALKGAIPGSVEVRGSDDADWKETQLNRFAAGDVRVLVSKPSIAGWGMNFQGCSHVVFVGLSHSFEQWYQAIRRTYRFGQSSPVQCHVVTSSAEGAVVANLRRKQADAEKMALGMVQHMAEITSAEIRATERSFTDYQPKKAIKIPSWIRTEKEAA